MCKTEVIAAPLIPTTHKIHVIADPLTLITCKAQLIADPMSRLIFSCPVAIYLPVTSAVKL